MDGRESETLNLQVSHPSPGYQGFSNPDKCPSFIADWDCRGAYVDSQYKALQAQVSSYLHSISSHFQPPGEASEANQKEMICVI